MLLKVSQCWARIFVFSPSSIVFSCHWLQKKKYLGLSGNCQKVIFLSVQSTSTPYAFHTWQKHWVWVVAKEAFIHVILEIHRGTSPIPWETPLFSVSYSGVGPCKHPHCCVDSDQLCENAVSPFLLGMASAPGHCSCTQRSQGEASCHLCVTFVGAQLEHLLCCLEWIYDALNILNATFMGHHSNKAGFLLLFWILLMHEEIQIWLSFGSLN